MLDWYYQLYSNWAEMKPKPVRVVCYSFDDNG